MGDSVARSLPEEAHAVEADGRTDSRTSDLCWLAKAEHWGEWLRFSETEMAEPQQVWMMRHDNGRVRFYEKGKGQVGPEHPHVAAATYWAFSERFTDPLVSMVHNLACRAEVAAGGIQEGAHVA